MSKRPKLTRTQPRIAKLGSLAKFARKLADRMQGSRGSGRSKRPATSLALAGWRPARTTAAAGALAGIADHVMRMRLPKAMEAMEIALLSRAMEEAGGNITAAGRLLGIHRKAVERALVKHKLGSSSMRRRGRPRRKR